MSEINEAENLRSDNKKRKINVSCEVVYNAFSDPEKLAKWWGPEGFSNTFKEFELREGGYWRFTMHGPDGTDYPNVSRFVEVIPNRKVVIEHFSGHHFFLTIKFITLGDSTEIEWYQLFDTIEHYQKIAEFVSKANDQNLDRLEAVVKDSRSNQ